MKKVFALLLALVMVLSLAACGEKKVTATFTPKDGADITDEQLIIAQSVIQVRLDSMGVRGYSTSVDYSADSIRLEFPLKEDAPDLDPAAVVKELAAIGRLTLRDPSGEVVMDGSEVKSATAKADTYNEGYIVEIELTEKGSEQFGDITERYLGQQISIYVDDELVSSPTVQAVIRTGNIQIAGIDTMDEAQKLARQIDSALPVPFVAIYEVSK